MNIIWMSEEIVIYTADSVDVSLSIDSENDTVWASTQQIADLFDVDAPHCARNQSLSFLVPCMKSSTLSSLPINGSFTVPSCEHSKTEEAHDARSSRS